MNGLIKAKYITDVSLARFDGYQLKENYGFRSYRNMFSIVLLISVSDVFKFWKESVR